MTRKYLKIVSKGKIYKVIIDKEDYEFISQYKWWLKHNKYVYTQINRKTIHLHRLVLNYSGKMQIDHINHNALDNRKSNLRIVTISQNSINKTNLKSGVTKFRNKYRARIKLKGKEIHIGIFDTLKEAMSARITKEIELFNKYSKHYKHD